MQFLALLLLTLLFFGAFLYLLMCVDPNSNSILSKISRLVFILIPKILRKLMGDRIINFFGSIINYIFNTNHPLIQYFYIIVAVGGYIVYSVYGFLSLFNDNPQVNYIHSIIGSILAFYSFFSYYQACHYSAGIINSKNVQSYIKEFQEFCDEVMYFPDNKCTTCDFVKPARSKHCRVCDVCVSRFDHHCVWIRQCVGQKNYKYFLKFIGIHALLCNYGGYYGLKALYGQSLKLNLYNMQFRNNMTKEVYQATYMTVAQYLFYTETMFCFVMILCWVMGITLTIFFIYHLFMVRYDITTNEKVKQSDFKEYFVTQINLMNNQLKNETNNETIDQLKKKIKRFQQNIDKINKIKNIGFIGGWKQVFSQPNEVKWRALENLKKCKQNTK